MHRLAHHVTRLCAGVLSLALIATTTPAAAEPAAPAAATNGAALECLAKAVYFEARGEPLDGQRAVAEVILNRVDSPRFPSTVCGVVTQSNRGGCQFSYHCSGRSLAIREHAA